MSFDLYFYKKKDNTLKEQDVAAYLTTNLPFNISESTRQWDYENTETGVYFVIEWNKSDELDFLEEFDEFICLNFTFQSKFSQTEIFRIRKFSNN